MESHAEDRCPHSGFYSGVGFYSHDSHTLRYLLICDECGEEMKEILALHYAPEPVFEPAA
jgi:hypothetical protein